MSTEPQQNSPQELVKQQEPHLRGLGTDEPQGMGQDSGQA